MQTIICRCDRRPTPARLFLCYVNEDVFLEWSRFFYPEPGTAVAVATGGCLRLRRGGQDLLIEPGGYVLLWELPQAPTVSGWARSCRYSREWIDANWGSHENGPDVADVTGYLKAAAQVGEGGRP